MKEYQIEIKIKASREALWNAITDFQNFPKWNSVLAMEGNDNLVVGEKFEVTINQPNGKQTKFKAVATSKVERKSFSATATIVGKWFYEAKHHFIVKEVDRELVIFIQKWELKGIMASMFGKQMIKELEVFNQMNRELFGLFCEK